MTATEDTWTNPTYWQPHPEYWHADDPYATETEVTVLVAAFVHALQPEIVLETGSNTGQTAEAIGQALLANGHGHLYSLEINETFAAQAEQRCKDLPVTIVHTSSLMWTPPGKMGFAWLDSETDIRHLELLRFREWFEDGAVIGIHDTAPHHMTSSHLRPLIDRGIFQAITLRTPRGVTFGTVNHGR